jgi:hypothetical protein
MIAFEICVNGKRLQTVSVGAFGVLSAEVLWDRVQTNAGPILEGCRIAASGLIGNGGDAVRWHQEKLRAGDVVTIRLIETDGLCDPPAEQSPRDEIRDMHA